MASGKKGLINFVSLYTMMIPGLLYLLINNYLPMAGLVIAFKRINFRLGIFKSPWVGFDNFRYLFATPDAFIITRNTILYNLSFIIIGTVVSILTALMLNEIQGRFAKSVYQNFILLPHLISMVVVGYLVYAFLSMDSGIINKTVLKFFGKESILWYQAKKYWPFILVFVNTWKGFGFSAVIYLSSIVGISKDYYEAAYLDGAGKFRQIWHITLPLIKPTIIILTLLAIGRMFYSDFGLFYQVPLNQGMLFDVTNTIDTYVYRALLVTGDMGMSSAVGFYQSVVGFICIVAANSVVRKIEAGSSLF
ncbi:sugar ABC transporter permease [Spirochaetia bacterium]|nr:sugar ABC transporter permease [Spirochaetia bacterium]